MLNSPVDIALLFGVALLVFGPKKLPELGKALGQGIGNFKRHLHEAQEEVKTAVRTEPAGQPTIETSASVPAGTICCSSDEADSPGAGPSPGK